MPVTDFVWSDTPEPHRARTRALLQAHPEVRALIGRNPWTAALLVGAVAVQLGLAAALKDQSWWLIVALAWAGGAFVVHALFVMVHECTHDLIFARRAHNMLAAIVANVPQCFPSAISFRNYHIKHHTHQGVPELDADLPSRWEASLIRHYSIGKVMWLVLFPVFQIARTFRIGEVRLLDPWVALNWVVVLSADVAVWWFLGPKALAFLVLSFAFSVGLHPLGARWIQEHYLTFGEQETTSYYGPLNVVALNVGYHNEHHDLPSVPWHRLPALRRAAPELYDVLHAHRGWTALLLRFVFDQELSLFSRIIRRNRGGVPLTDQSRPDLDTTPR